MVMRYSGNTCRFCNNRRWYRNCSYCPSFGDDNLVAKKNGIGSLTLVDGQGRFTKEMAELSGQYVKEEFYTDWKKKPKYPD